MMICQIGNSEAPQSTENHLNYALSRIDGVRVDFIHENDPNAWELAIRRLRAGDYHAAIWTTTAQFQRNVGFERSWRMLDAARRSNTVTIAYHLDRWWGLDREEQLDWPFFSCDIVYTADGGHDIEFQDRGINHRWMPPAIDERYCYVTPVEEREPLDIIFVGGWDNYGHREWTHRDEMLSAVRAKFGRRLVLLPGRGEPRISGHDLNRLYASAKVVIGDSCLVPRADGTPMVRYCSDRIPETIGRGGYLLHPEVEGVTGPGGLFYDPSFPLCDHWELGDMSQLIERIEQRLDIDPATREDEARRRVELVADEHTYTARMLRVIADIEEAS